MADDNPESPEATLMRQRLAIIERELEQNCADLLESEEEEQAARDKFVRMLARLRSIPLSKRVTH